MELVALTTSGIQPNVVVTTTTTSYQTKCAALVEAEAGLPAVLPPALWEVVVSSPTMTTPRRHAQFVPSAPTATRPKKPVGAKVVRSASGHQPPTPLQPRIVPSVITIFMRSGQLASAAELAGQLTVSAPPQSARASATSVTTWAPPPASPARSGAQQPQTEPHRSWIAMFAPLDFTSMWARLLARLAAEDLARQQSDRPR